MNSEAWRTHQSDGFVSFLDEFSGDLRIWKLTEKRAQFFFQVANKQAYPYISSNKIIRRYVHAFKSAFHTRRKYWTLLLTKATCSFGIKSLEKVQ